MHILKPHLQLTQDGATVLHTAYDTEIIEIYEYAHWNKNKLHCGKSLINGIWIHTAQFYKHSGQNRNIDILAEDQLVQQPAYIFNALAHMGMAYAG